MPLNIDRSSSSRPLNDLGESQNVGAPRLAPDSEVSTQSPSSILSGLASEYRSATDSPVTPPLSTMSRAERRMGMVGEKAISQGDRLKLSETTTPESSSNAASPSTAKSKESTPKNLIPQDYPQKGTPSSYLQHDPYQAASPSDRKQSKNSLLSKSASSTAASNISFRSVRSALLDVGSSARSNFKNALGKKAKSFEDLRKQGVGIQVHQEVRIEDSGSVEDRERLKEQDKLIQRGKFGHIM